MLIVIGASGGLGSGLIEYLQENPSVGRLFGEVVGVSRADFDLTDPAAVEGYFQAVDTKLPLNEPIFLINAAGRSLSGFAHKLSLADWDRTIQDNLTANFLILKAVAPLLKTRPGSSLLIFSSIVAEIGVPGTIAYAASKGALRGFVRTAARELSRLKATINVVELGYFDRGMIEQVSKEHIDRLISEIPVGRLGNLEDLFGACQFALSCKYLTGSIIKLNGGLT